MKPKIKIATSKTPNGSEIILYQHDNNFSIRIGMQELMNSRQHESELELARLGCAAFVEHKTPSILVGGLGMGYTLRQVLDMLKPKAKVVVSELLDAVVEWNRNFLGDLNSHPLQDKRVEIRTGDVIRLITRSKNTFDAILLDIDNGPGAMTDSGNKHLYTREGMLSCRRALREHGCLSIWSSEPSKNFEHVLMSCNFHVRRFRVPAYKGSKSLTRFVWVTSMDESVLPEGGGAPRPPIKKTSKGNRKSFRQQHSQSSF